MKKIIMTLCVVSGLAFAFGGHDDVFVVKLSSSEWQEVKMNVDTNGFCRIPAQNVCIVITNGLPDIAVQHISTHGGNRVKETDPHGVLPYSGQDL